jgi:ISXO2-like transposase domain
MMEDNDDLLGGIVEVDETYLGGKKRKKGQTSERELDDAEPKGRSGTRKSMVTVAAERGGRAKAEKGKTHSERTIAAFVLKKLDRLGTVLVTDELPAYRWIGRKFAAHLCVRLAFGAMASVGCFRRNSSAPAWSRLRPAISLLALTLA